MWLYCIADSSVHTDAEYQLYKYYILFSQDPLSANI